MTHLDCTYLTQAHCKMRGKHCGQGAAHLTQVQTEQAPSSPWPQCEALSHHTQSCPTASYIHPTAISIRFLTTMSHTNLRLTDCHTNQTQHALQPPSDHPNRHYLPTQDVTSYSLSSAHFCILTSCQSTQVSLLRKSLCHTLRLSVPARMRTKRT